MKRLLFDCGSRDGASALGFFFLRVSTGLMMLFGHGLPKWRNFGTLKEQQFLVQDFMPLSLMSPQVSLIAVIGAEVFASALLVLGLLTRPAAFVFSFAMVVAAFSHHAGDPWFSTGGASKELALMYLIPGIVLLLSGAGAWSLDAALSPDGKKRRW